LKNKTLFVITLVLFLAINTSYFWIDLLDFFAIIVFLFFIVAFIGIFVALIPQVYYLFKEKFENKKRIILVIFILVVLISSILKPNGIINYEWFESNPILIAQREGVANCMTTIKLKENNTFTIKLVCFGLTKVYGDYYIKNDTVYFKNIRNADSEKQFYEFAVLSPSKTSNSKYQYLILFRNRKNDKGYEMNITSNKLHL
jgi:hypothetical protein